MVFETQGFPNVEGSPPASGGWPAGGAPGADPPLPIPPRVAQIRALSSLRSREAGRRVAQIRALSSLRSRAAGRVCLYSRQPPHRGHSGGPLLVTHHYPFHPS